MDAVVAALITAVVTFVVSGPVAYLYGLHRSRKDRLEEKRAEVIAELSRLLFEVQDSYLHWSTLSFPPAVGGDEVAKRQVEKAKAAVKSQNDLILCYYSNIAWLTPETAGRLETFIREVQDLSVAYGSDLRDLHFQLSPEGQEIAKRMRTEIPPLREELIREFRAILDPRSPWSRLFGSRG